MGTLSPVHWAILMFLFIGSLLPFLIVSSRKVNKKSATPIKIFAVIGFFFPILAWAAIIWACIAKTTDEDEDLQSSLESLEKLHAAKEKGIFTDEEFQEAKKKILEKG